MKILLLAFAIMVLLMRIKNTPKYLNKDIFQKQIQDLLDRFNNCSKEERKNISAWFYDSNLYY